ncbi:MAG: YjcZ family sporulation protein [Bacilli bacterium]|nr:YjcZ family sporulation protein [Bacilli bacterium]
MKEKKGGKYMPNCGSSTAIVLVLFILLIIILGSSI